jgi:hypothetical protein
MPAMSSSGPHPILTLQFFNSQCGSVMAKADFRAAPLGKNMVVQGCSAKCTAVDQQRSNQAYATTLADTHLTIVRPDDPMLAQLTPAECPALPCGMHPHSTSKDADRRKW